MATHTITLEVDNVKLFDMLKSMEQEDVDCSTDALGVRMAELLMAPANVGFADKVGLALYGIAVKGVEKHTIAVEK